MDKAIKHVYFVNTKHYVSDRDEYISCFVSILNCIVYCIALCCIVLFIKQPLIYVALNE